jgi:serine/threonine protein kinase
VASLLERLQPSLGQRYALAGELGEGGMAIVFRATDLKHERDVAVKVLRPELSAVVGADRFLREIRVTARLQHPHILPLYDSGVAGDLLYYVMPLVRGESLRDRLSRERQLPVSEAVHITAGRVQEHLSPRRIACAPKRRSATRPPINADLAILRIHADLGNVVILQRPTNHRPESRTSSQSCHPADRIAR